MHTVLVVIEIILSIALMTVVLLQPGKSDGLRGLMAGNNETFFSRNKSRTKEAVLFNATIILAVLFAGVTIAMNLIK